MYRRRQTKDGDPAALSSRRAPSRATARSRTWSQRGGPMMTMIMIKIFTLLRCKILFIDHCENYTMELLHGKLDQVPKEIDVVNA